MSEEKYDNRRNVIYKVFPDFQNLKEWYKYDKNNNMIYAKDSNGFEIWKEYDEENRKIHYRDNKGGKKWYKYNKNGERATITEKEYEKINFNKRKEVSRFDLMEL